MTDSLAPGVLTNVLTHGTLMALVPVATFFFVAWLGFSDVWSAIAAVLMVHICLASFIYRAWKEEVNSGFEKKSIQKKD
jgi:positive regulator of sigma E activity